MLGLKRDQVALCEYQDEWAKIATEMINEIWDLLKGIVLDMQHIGSTAIKGIISIPILDIVVMVNDFNAILHICSKLSQYSVYQSKSQSLPETFICEIEDRRECGIVISNLHIVLKDSAQWIDYINFRDYMNAFPEKAAAYGKVKTMLARQYPTYREAYCSGKNEFIVACISEARTYFDMKQKMDIVKYESINKGLSSDKKYYLETTDGKRYLLRISDVSKYKHNKRMFEILKIAADMGIPMCKPVDFGLCNSGTSAYQLLSWCEGVNLDKVLSTFPVAEQFALGKKAGGILMMIHGIPVPFDFEDWSVRYSDQNDLRIKAFLSCGIQIDGSDNIVKFIEDNKNLLRNRPQCFNHGDFHTGNLMITNNGNLSVIDWEILDFENVADPWYEFNRIGNSELCSYFTTGLIRGYFDGEPPNEFWRLLAFYLASGSLMLVSWAYYIRQDMLDYSIQQVRNVIKWYDSMQCVIPDWYISNYYS